MIIIISFLNALISAASGEYDAELTRYAICKKLEKLGLVVVVVGLYLLNNVNQS
jgi:hypothetical protein